MPDLSVVIPVLNERENVSAIVHRLRAVLADVKWEVVFVDDDSEDGTADVCRRWASEDPRVRVVHRVGRRGLASACVEGMMSTASPWIAVMDGDLQHDESVLPAMLARATEGGLDMVIASRNITGGSMGEFAQWRVGLSNAGRRLSGVVLKSDVSDPMSGFFLVSRSFLLEVVHSLSTFGFKIALDILASSKRPVRLAEVPFVFRNREYGCSKLDTAVGLDLLLLIADKLVGNLLPVRFAFYLLVGATGVIVHVAALAVFRAAMPGASILVPQIAATSIAILSNFILNNQITFRDRKLKGRKSILRGLLWYSAACSVGAAANVETTGFLAGIGMEWYIAGAVGVLITAVWNFAAASLLAWKIGRRRREYRRTAIRSVSMATGVGS
jgi:dolichol-phosphate mannosyltransferase